MRINDLTARALGNLRRNKSRTILTSLSVAVGAVTIILTLGLSTAVNSLVNDELSSSVENAEIYVTKQPENESDDKTIPEYNPNSSYGYDEISGSPVTLSFLEQKDIDNFSEVEGVRSVTPDYSVEIEYIALSSGSDKKLSVDSMDASVANYKTEIGMLPGIDGWATDQIVLSSGYTKSFGLDNPSDLLDRQVDLAFYSYQDKLITRQVKVIGVLEEEGGLGSDASSGVIITGPELLQDIYQQQSKNDKNFGKFVSATILLNDANDEEAVKTAIENLGDYEVTSLGDIIKQISSALDVIKFGLLGFGGIALLAATFGIVNTQLMSVYERTREIGLFKALGMSSKSVGGIFSLEATWVGVLGASLGILLGFAIQLFVNNNFEESLSAFNGTVIDIQWLDALRVLIGLALLSFLAGALPSRKASKLDPITALRDE